MSSPSEKDADTASFEAVQSAKHSAGDAEHRREFQGSRWPMDQSRPATRFNEIYIPSKPILKKFDK